MIQLSLVAFFFLFLFQQTGNSRFVPRSVINTTAILSLDEDIKLNSDEGRFHVTDITFRY